MSYLGQTLVPHPLNPSLPATDDSGMHSFVLLRRPKHGRELSGVLFLPRQWAKVRVWGLGALELKEQQFLSKGAAHGYRTGRVGVGPSAS